MDGVSPGAGRDPLTPDGARAPARGVTGRRVANTPRPRPLCPPTSPRCPTRRPVPACGVARGRRPPPARPECPGRRLTKRRHRARAAAREGAELVDLHAFSVRCRSAPSRVRERGNGFHPSVSGHAAVAACLRRGAGADPRRLTCSAGRSGGGRTGLSRCSRPRIREAGGEATPAGEAMVSAES